MSCRYEGCNKEKIRARGLCSRHWSLEQYGKCTNDCELPARDKKGWCANCIKRGGPPATRRLGWKYNTEESRWCNVCKSVQRVGNFKSHTSRCDGCQGLRKKNTHARVRREVMEWQLANVEQTRNGWCVKCLKPYGEFYHFDHITPYSLGGSDNVTNIQVMCAWCNQSKGNRESVDYRVLITHEKELT